MSMNSGHQTFSEWLWEQMVKHEWSQVDLARHANITKQAVNNYLNNDRIPKKDAMEKLAHALKLPVETLYRAAGVLPSITEAEAKLLQLEEIYRNISDDKRDEFLRYGEYLREQEERSRGSAVKLNPKTEPR